MKTDLDTILYIIISIIIIALSALGRRRRKAIPRIPQQEGIQDEPVAANDSERLGTMFLPDSDHFEKRLKMFETSSDIENLEGESLEEIHDEEAEIEDEEEVILAGEQESTVEEDREEDLEMTKKDQKYENVWLELFKEPDDIRKAIIYSEILKRKDF